MIYWKLSIGINLSQRIPHKKNAKSDFAKLKYFNQSIATPTLKLIYFNSFIKDDS